MPAVYSLLAVGANGQVALRMNVGEGAIDQSAEHVVIGHRKLRGSIRSRCSSRSSSLFRNDPAHINTRKFPIDPPATLNLEAPKSSVYGLTLASGHIRAGMVTHADLAALHEARCQYVVARIVQRHLLIGIKARHG
jgi:hypothetical protein